MLLFELHGADIAWRLMQPTVDMEQLNVIEYRRACRIAALKIKVDLIVRRRRISFQPQSIAPA
jgi:hypothetical protein